MAKKTKIDNKNKTFLFNKDRNQSGKREKINIYGRGVHGGGRGIICSGIGRGGQRNFYSRNNQNKS